MKRTNIYLDENLDRLIRYLAVQQGRSFTDIVREALNDYAKAQGYPDPSRVRMPLPMTKEEREEWRAGFQESLARLRADVPKDMTPEEIDAEIDAAIAEVRRERWANRQVLTTHD